MRKMCEILCEASSTHIEDKTKNKLVESLVECARRSFPNFKGDVIVQDDMIAFSGRDLHVPQKKVGAYIKEGIVYSNGSAKDNTLEIANYAAKILKERLSRKQERANKLNESLKSTSNAKILTETSNGRFAIIEGYKNNKRIYSYAEKGSQGKWVRKASFISLDKAQEYFDSNAITEGYQSALTAKENIFCKRYNLTEETLGDFENILNFYDDSPSDLRRSLCEKFDISNESALNMVHDYNIIKEKQ